MKNIAGTWGIETIFQSAPNSKMEYRIMPSYSNKEKYVIGRVDKGVAHGNIWVEYLTDLYDWQKKEKNKAVRLKEFNSIEEAIEYLSK